MKSPAARFDFVPYPWPVKPALLFILGLPEDATKEEYEAKWNELVAPARDGNWAKELFMKEVQAFQAKGESYERAWELAQTASSIGKKAWLAWNNKTSQANQNFQTSLANQNFQGETEFERALRKSKEAQAAVFRAEKAFLSDLEQRKKQQSSQRP